MIQPVLCVCNYVAVSSYELYYTCCVAALDKSVILSSPKDQTDANTEQFTDPPLDSSGEVPDQPASPDNPSSPSSPSADAPSDAASDASSDAMESGEEGDGDAPKPKRRR